MGSSRARVIALALGVVVAAAALIVSRALVHQDRELLPACIEDSMVPGIDVSYYQDQIAWPRVRRAGIRFAFVRVSDGTSVPDPMFARNWAEAKTAHVMRGAYQYFRPDQSVVAQADLMIAAIGRDRGELAPVIDVEVTGGKSPVKLAEAIRAWVGRVRDRLGVEPMVYTSPDFWRDEVGGADLSSQPLWLAHYTTECPRVPAPWTQWTFWQHSKTGQVPGIEGPVDLDVFAGELGARLVETETANR